jgi:hypothetical protein
MQVMSSIAHHRPLCLNRLASNRFSQQYLKMSTPASVTFQDATSNDGRNKAIDDFVEQYAQLSKSSQGSPILSCQSEHDLQTLRNRIKGDARAYWKICIEVRAALSHVRMETPRYKSIR